MSQDFVVDRDSDEYKKWVEYAHRAREYDMLISEEERLKPPTTVLEFVAHEYGVCSQKMAMLTLYL